MHEPEGLGGAAAALRDDIDSVVDAWLDRYEVSTLRIPGPVDRRALRHMLAPAAGALAEALGDGDVAALPGAPALRELEKQLSFLGGTLVTERKSAFDAAALVFALRDALASCARDEGERGRTRALFDWFVAVTLEGVAQSNRRAALERHRELVEARTPVVLVGDDIPAAFPLGDADIHGMRGALARLVMQIARVGARAVIIDASGLRDADSDGIVEALYEYCTHRKIAGNVALVVCGLEPRAERAWREVAHKAGVTLHLVDKFPVALHVAGECS